MKSFLIACIFWLSNRVASWAGDAYEKEMERKFNLPPNHMVHQIAKTMVEDLDNYPLARAILLEAAFRGMSNIKLDHKP